MATERGYHHGDLRAALIARALDVVETQGHEAVSLRALAEELGVSRGAPYRHFQERDQLLAEVASIGFERLAALVDTESGQFETPALKLADAARQFLGFVDGHPQLFRLIFESGLLQRTDAFPHLADAQNAVYRKILAVYAAAADGSGTSSPGLQARVIAFWSTIFGYAKLRQAALLQPYMMGDLDPAAIEDQVIRAAMGPDIAAS